MRLVGLALSALALSALALAAPASAAPVTVNVTGVRTNVGKVIVSLCTKRQFGVSACTYTTATPARTGGVSVVFNTVAPGRYMAAAFQDLDGDGELRFTPHRSRRTRRRQRPGTPHPRLRQGRLRRRRRTQGRRCQAQVAGE